MKFDEGLHEGVEVLGILDFIPVKLACCPTESCAFRLIDENKVCVV